MVFWLNFCNMLKLFKNNVMIHSEVMLPIWCRQVFERSVWLDFRDQIKTPESLTHLFRDISGTFDKIRTVHT